MGIADVAGVLGAAAAALCCAGTPFIVAGLTALGLSFLRRDAILWPIMIASLGVAQWDSGAAAGCADARARSSSDLYQEWYWSPESSSFTASRQWK